ncbi:hypothetical protein AKJ09_09341 [Labilithrix luteola]|uniref:Outer membrane protein beta-barrel domain-containing protein n=1 Tax=Labilithrix luteola TaxID=1391654 RepID=A0A0K1QAB4_9BACT|nr:hypothetical protein [Labilithrix luteola]AKV02678.1 hypothetical protein AKJ09_09341 [Labilithrix luteola]
MRSFLSLLLALVAFSAANSSFADTSSSDDEEAPSEDWTKPRNARSKDDHKNFAIAGDFLFTVPVGALADTTGPLLGASLRVGVYASPTIEGYLRVGYQRGMKKQVLPFLLNGAVDDLPILVGTRIFAFQPGAGVYVNAEMGARILFFRGDVALFDSSNTIPTIDSVIRFGGNAGAGYVLSREVPIDIGVQVAAFNLAGGGQNDELALGVTSYVAYEARF